MIGSLLRLALTSALVLLASATALAAKRVALVVGNDEYDNLPKLERAVNDARAVGAALSEIGFEVISGENLSRRDMNRKLADLEKALAPGDIVFFFFAGHGVAIGGDNVLLSTDMPEPQQGEEGLVREEGFTVDSVIRRLQSRGTETALLVLDACRDNPFEASGTRNIGLSRGLAKLDAPTGVFVLFSAGIGQTALDRLPNDSDPNSVFTRKLVPTLKTAGLSHVGIAKRVQKEVGALAASVKHKQQPAYYDQIDGEIFLITAVEAAPPMTKADEAGEAWLELAETNDEAALTEFSAEFADTPFGSLARLRIEELRKQAELNASVKISEERAKKAEEELERQQQLVAALATTAQSAPAADQLPTQEDTEPLVRSLQTELARVGCYTAEIDGKWGNASRQALRLFSTHANAELSVDVPSEDALIATKAMTEKICPLECSSGYQIHEGKCVVEPSSNSIKKVAKPLRTNSKPSSTQRKKSIKTQDGSASVQTSSQDIPARPATSKNKRCWKNILSDRCNDPAKNKNGCDKFGARVPVPCE